MAAIISATKHEIAEMRPFSRAQFKSTRGQRMTERIFFIFEIVETERFENVFFEIQNRPATV